MMQCACGLYNTQQPKHERALIDFRTFATNDGVHTKPVTSEHKAAVAAEAAATNIPVFMTLEGEVERLTNPRWGY